jgi:shikimate kinase
MNKNPRNIYLVGFMATGKTAAGKELARKKKWQFVDLDDLIELREKMAISDIFTKKGEPYFRIVEKQVLKDVAKEKKFVVACGGGIVIEEANIQTMKKTGMIICLTADVQAILKRTACFTRRPLLNVENPRERIETLLKLRAPYYAQADKAIDTSRLSIKEVVDKISKILSRKK